MKSNCFPLLLCSSLILGSFTLTACKSDESPRKTSVTTEPVVEKADSSSEVSGAEQEANSGSSQSSLTVEVSDEDKKTLFEADSTSGLRLVDAGVGDKLTYRYELKENESSPMKMSMQMALRMKIDGQQVPTPPNPTTIMPMVIESKALADGWLALEAKYEEVQLEAAETTPPALLEQLKNAMAPISDVSVSWEVDNRGTMRNLAFNTQPNTPPHLNQILEQTKQSLKNFFVVLPEEAIGDSAKWVLTIDDYNVGGISQTLKALYKVVERTESELKLDVVILSSIKEQMLQTADTTAAGMSVKVLPTENYSVGTIEINLATLAPVSKISGTSRVSMEMTGGAPEQRTTQLMETEADVSLLLTRE